MKFAISYSFGKDSTLALHRMLRQGHCPVALLVMVNTQMDRSWFHGVDRTLMEKIGEALQIPMILCESDGASYHWKLEQGMREAAALGAEACVFGDIDLEDNARWCRERCTRTGLRPVFPLWKQPRELLVHEAVSLGYTARIKCLRSDLLPEEMLGHPLCSDILHEMKQKGIDICGENGEYHTLVTGGPIFAHPVPVRRGPILHFGSLSAMDITWEDRAERSQSFKEI